MSNNKKPNIIDAKTNAINLDTVGQALLNAARRGEAVDSSTAMLLAFLLAECRNYSTKRDGDLLDDETSNLVRDHLKGAEDANAKQEEVSTSEAADEIIKDLRNSGINL